MKEYQTKYYVIYSDLDEATVKEATARITTMAEEYHERTKDFAGSVRKRLPVYLFSNFEDYKGAGGVGVGFFSGDRLMAWVPNGGAALNWRTLQHEGFRQFASQAVGYAIPVWVNEGLGEYFGEGVWTGDALVTGVVSSERLSRVKTMISGGQLRPFDQMFFLNYMQWISQFDMKNYDQAWAMVHFLVNGDNQKYRKAFSQFLRDCSNGKDALGAFQAHFGANLKPFQDRFTAWWQALPAEPTPDLYATAVVHTYTSFLARANAAKQTFKDWDEFLAAAKGGTLQSPPDSALPPSLLDTAVSSAAGGNGTWSLNVAGKSPKVVFTRADGVVFTGDFTAEGKDSKEFKTRVAITRPAPRPAAEK